MKIKDINYEKAMAELESIVKKMESGELDIDVMSEELKKAKALVKYCKDKLMKAEEELQKIFEESAS